jgi:anti-sigma regulatory factor (Ser/Thr protein kinase)
MLWSHELVLAAHPASAAKARAFVAHQLVEHRLFFLVDDVRLVASELATNALLHARTEFTVVLEGREHSLLLTVSDGSPIAPAPLRGVSNGLHTAGRGLPIVSMISQSWGILEQHSAAKSVWASFETRSLITRSEG